MSNHKHKWEAYCVECSANTEDCKAFKTKAEEKLIKIILTKFVCEGTGPNGCSSGICIARDAVRRQREREKK